MTNIKDLSKKRIAILGIGVNNQELLLWLLKHGVKNITIFDKNPNVKFPMSNQTQMFNVKCQTGKKYLDGLEKFDMVFRTPGISYFHPKIQTAIKNGVEISSQTKLFFDLCPAKIIGITGTKGKGTTATLIYKILRLASEYSSFSGSLASLFPRPARSTATSFGMHPRPHIFLAGNIGKDPFEFLDRVKRNDIVVLELSSFQLQDLHKSPHIAVILNITSDHLDYHKKTKEYVDAKLNIVRHQSKKDFTVINLDYLTSFKFAAASPTDNDYYFSTRKSVDLGTFILDEKIILRTEEKEYNICKTSDIKLLGPHNLENICAAVSASYLAGADIQSIKKIITTFAGREHRLELVREHKRVKFYNDSASTNPDTAIAAIKSFSAPIILIAGGSDKGADYSKLGKVIAEAKNIKKIILVGKTAGKIESGIRNYKLRIKNKTKIEKYHSFAEAINKAIKSSESGDIVLLSPASASFDMFKNYEERGNIFKKIVNNIR